MNDINSLELRLTLKVEEINNILMALQELPAKIANPLSTKIAQQAEPQVPKIKEKTYQGPPIQQPMPVSLESDNQDTE